MLFTPENIVAFLTLTALEIVLGIDNIIFIAILVERLPKHLQAKARRLGLVMAMLMRIMLLLAIGWIMMLTTPFFELFGHGFSGRDIILFVGGLFLIGKATHEIHDKLQHPGENELTMPKGTGFTKTIVQIMLLDIIFSLDSVITAVGMAQHVSIMIAAVVASVCVMLVCSGAIAEFITKNPTFKILALSFLLLVGVVLVADSFGRHVEKGYIYFAMAFSFFVELLNMRAERIRQKGVVRR